MSSDMPTINMAATGANIKALIKNKGLRVADVQIRCGFSTPQAIFKWMRGDAMPTIDNMVILAHLLDVTIDKIIILEAKGLRENAGMEREICTGMRAVYQRRTACRQDDHCRGIRQERIKILHYNQLPVGE